MKLEIWFPKGITFQEFKKRFLKEYVSTPIIIRLNNLNCTF